VSKWKLRSNAESQIILAVKDLLRMLSSIEYQTLWKFECKERQRQSKSSNCRHCDGRVWSQH